MEESNNNPSIIDEIIESLNVSGKKKIKVTKGKKSSKKAKNNSMKEIEDICKVSENIKLYDEDFIERKSVYKVDKKEVKEQYDIIMDCDKSDYIIYHKRK